MEPFSPSSLETHLSLSCPEKSAAVARHLSPFLLTVDQCQHLKRTFIIEMDRGASADSSERSSSCLLMENTFMTRLPTGKEAGDFLSLDLGSTNFRVILSRLRSSSSSSSSSSNHQSDQFTVRYYDVPMDLRVGPSAKPLFSFLAACISDFLDRFSKDSDAAVDPLPNRLPLAFSFSYPMVQKSVDSGFLVTWTKSYDLPDAVGTDAVLLLKQAIAAVPGLNVDVVAILNDSTGTLLQGAYTDQDCVIGMIFGSGFNACFVERVANLPKLTAEDGKALAGAETVAVDIECGAFGDNGCIDAFKTEVDRQLDADSMFQKSFS